MNSSVCLKNKTDMRASKKTISGLELLAFYLSQDLGSTQGFCHCWRPKIAISWFCLEMMSFCNSSILDIFDPFFPSTCSFPLATNVVSEFVILDIFRRLSSSLISLNSINGGVLWVLAKKTMLHFHFCSIIRPIVYSLGHILIEKLDFTIHVRWA